MPHDEVLAICLGLSADNKNSSVKTKLGHFRRLLA
jgi:hypothetical protein